MKTGKCSLCKGKYKNYGNNSEPLSDGRCCDECNVTKVLPARIERYRREVLC